MLRNQGKDNTMVNPLKDGGNSPVADFPCWNCNQNYISIDIDLYPYGHCINCGEENGILKCIRCSTLYSAEDGGEDFCEYCLEKIEKE
jgi:DNA-directed RNA polymerase subunit RPC12/RpoP